MENTSLGNYNLTQKIGEGRFAEVYLAHRQGSPHTLRTIKLFKFQVAENMPARNILLAETIFLTELYHPNIAKTYDAGFENDRLYIVSEHIPGETLHKKLERLKMLPVDETKKIGMAILSALAYAHSLGMIHSELADRNVFLREGSNEPVLADFHLEKLFSRPELQELVKLCPAPESQLDNISKYHLRRAPETALREEFSAKTDIFQFGVIMYDCLLGKDASLGSELPHPINERPEVPAKISEIIMHCLSDKPQRRPSSPILILNEFAKITTTERIQPSATPRPKPKFTHSLKNEHAPQIQSMRAMLPGFKKPEDTAKTTQSFRTDSMPQFDLSATTDRAAGVPNEEGVIAPAPKPAQDKDPGSIPLTPAEDNKPKTEIPLEPISRQPESAAPEKKDEPAAPAADFIPSFVRKVIDNGPIVPSQQDMEVQEQAAHAVPPPQNLEPAPLRAPEVHQLAREEEFPAAAEQPAEQPPEQEEHKPAAAEPFKMEIEKFPGRSGIGSFQSPEPAPAPAPEINREQPQQNSDQSQGKKPISFSFEIERFNKLESAPAPAPAQEEAKPEPEAPQEQTQDNPPAQEPEIPEQERSSISLATSGITPGAPAQPILNKYVPVPQQDLPPHAVTGNTEETTEHHDDAKPELSVSAAAAMPEPSETKTEETQPAHESVQFESAAEFVTGEATPKEGAAHEQQPPSPPKDTGIADTRENAAAILDASPQPAKQPEHPRSEPIPDIQVQVKQHTVFSLIKTPLIILLASSFTYYTAAKYQAAHAAPDQKDTKTFSSQNVSISKTVPIPMDFDSPLAKQVNILPGMALISEGKFYFGPTERETLLHGFLIDKNEVSVSMYKSCVQSGKCKTPSVSSEECTYGKEGNLPMNCVSWEEALSYCKAEDKRLPTEAEWERAAKGTDRRPYPWGEDKPDCAHTVFTDASGAGCGKKGPWATGSKKDLSPYNVADMAGNVNEYTMDWYEENYSMKAEPQNPKGPASGSAHTIKGGSWADKADDIRNSNRRQAAQDSSGPETGFRCAKDI